MNVILQTTLDRETGPSYSLVIQANDSIATITATLTITVSDVNDNDPVIAASNPASFYLPENRSPSTITTISVTDGDIGVNEDIYYELTNTFGAVFSISQTGGVLSQIRPFDFDTTETYMLEVSDTIELLKLLYICVSRTSLYTLEITTINSCYFYNTYISKCF